MIGCRRWALNQQRVSARYLQESVLSCPPHGHGQHAGEIRFWPLPQERLALHHVVNGFGDIGRVIAHALEILCTKHQVAPKEMATDFSIIYARSSCDRLVHNRSMSWSRVQTSTAFATSRQAKLSSTSRN